MDTKYFRFNSHCSEYIPVGTIVNYGIKSTNCGKDWHDYVSPCDMTRVEIFIENGRQFEFSSYSSGSSVTVPKGFGRVTNINKRGFTVEIL